MTSLWGVSQVQNLGPALALSHCPHRPLQAESAASSRPAVGGALQWLRNLGHSAQNMVSGRSDDLAEDPAYLKVSVNNKCCHEVDISRSNHCDTSRGD